MFIHVGVGRYGRVDCVPKVLHVDTDFLHVCFVPLIPIGTYAVRPPVSRNGRELRTRIGLSARSVLMGWFRALLVAAVIGCLVAAIYAALEMADRPRAADDLSSYLAGGLIGATVAVGLYWITQKYSTASHNRARELAEILGVRRDVIDQHYPEVALLLEDTDPFAARMR